MLVIIQLMDLRVDDSYLILLQFLTFFTIPTTYVFEDCEIFEKYGTHKVISEMLPNYIAMLRRNGHIVPMY